MRSVLACPRCRGGLEWHGSADASCTSCGEAYAGDDGVPRLLDRDGLPGHSAAQAREHDQVADPELDLERPRGTPALHGWLLAERFRRSVEGLEDLLGGALAVTVCGGPGMDAELLAAAGCRVIATDVSGGATRRVRERARRRGLPVLAVVAEAERLPLPDRAVDVAYVHDGLHHLEDPLAGLREMARVARRAVIVSEPAAAGLTRAAVRLRLARNVEAAGNRVARLDADAVEAVLRAHGFEQVGSRRYGMHYDPGVGALARALSRPRLLPVARGALLAANRVAGDLGNKLVVHGVRAADPGVRSRPVGSRTRRPIPAEPVRI